MPRGEEGKGNKGKERNRDGGTWGMPSVVVINGAITRLMDDIRGKEMCLGQEYDIQTSKHNQSI